MPTYAIMYDDTCEGRNKNPARGANVHVDNERPQIVVSKTHMYEIRYGLPQERKADRNKIHAAIFHPHEWKQSVRTTRKDIPFGITDVK